MRQATANHDWDLTEATADDRRLHPLRSRLRVAEIADIARAIEAEVARNAPAPEPPAILPPAEPMPRREPVKPVKGAEATPRPVEAGRSRGRRIGSAIGYILAGFILGAVFWHFVGFWDFVGQIMFRGTPRDGQISQAPAPVKLKERAPGSPPLAVALEPGACTTLALDRETGATLATDCDGTALPLRSLKTARREDLWITAGQRIQEATSKRWSLVTVEVTEPTPPALVLPEWQMQVRAD